MNLKELTEKLNGLMTETDTLLTKAKLTEEEQTRFSELTDSVKETRGMIDKVKVLDEARDWSNQPADADPPVVEIRDNAVITAGPDKILAKPFGIADRCVALRDAARGGSIDPRLKEIRAAQGAEAGLGSEGGLLIGTEKIDINKKMYEGPDNLLSYVDQRTVGAGFDSVQWLTLPETSRKNTYRNGGIIGYYQGEADTIDFRNPKWGDGELKLTELLAIIPATDRMLRDAVGFDSYASNLIAKEFKFQANRGIVAGTGTAMPLGLRSAGGAKSIAIESGQLADTIEYANIVKMRSGIGTESLSSGKLVWLYHPTCFPQLSQMTMVVGTGGVPVWLPANGISGKEFDTLYGYPAIPSEFLPELGNAKDIMLVDLDEYLWISKGGMQADISIHVYFTSNQTLFRFKQAVNGMPKCDSEVTLYEGTETVSPYTYIAERA